MLAGDRAQLYSQKRESGVDTSAIAGPWSEARSKGESGSWLLVGFDDAVKDKVVVRGAGEGGLATLKQTLLAEGMAGSIAFAGFPFRADGGVRFAFVTWVGPSVSALKKGKVSLQKAGVYNAFDGVVADVGIVGSADDLEEAAVGAALKKAIGKGDISF
jgi:hypothetical protein